MPRQLNLRVNEEFASRLERVSRRLGRPMATVLEEFGTPALAEVEADLQFEAEALAAWEDYQLTGTHVTTEEIDAIFAAGHARAGSVPEDTQK